jgi:DNA-binding FrmR family transcriptional regulator
MAKKRVSHKTQLSALRRIEGQVRGIQKMIEEARHCPEILNALASIRGALRKVEMEVLKGHLDAGVRKAFYSSSPKAKEKKLREIYKLLESLRK